MVSSEEVSTWDHLFWLGLPVETSRPSRLQYFLIKNLSTRMAELFDHLYLWKKSIDFLLGDNHQVKVACETTS